MGEESGKWKKGLTEGGGEEDSCEPNLFHRRISPRKLIDECQSEVEVGEMEIV